MNFSEFFIKKPVFCIVLSTFILLIGFLSLLDLPLRQYPDTEKSIVTIDTVYPGAASTIVETKITEIIENQISGIEGIKSISSVSRDGRSKITIEFIYEKNINETSDTISFKENFSSQLPLGLPRCVIRIIEAFFSRSILIVGIIF